MLCFVRNVAKNLKENKRDFGWKSYRLAYYRLTFHLQIKQLSAYATISASEDVCTTLLFPPD